MTATSHGVPGHDNGLASLRLRLGKLHHDPARGYVWDMTSEGPYEVICPACGDDPSWNYSDISPELQAIRGNHATAEVGRAALEEHIGIRR
jgi:hypothetical protein